MEIPEIGHSIQVDYEGERIWVKVVKLISDDEFLVEMVWEEA